MAKETKAKQPPPDPVPKRTSQGRDHAPLNKHKRRSWKRYRGQGWPK